MLNNPLAMARQLRTARTKQPMTAQGPQGPIASVPAPKVAPSGGMQLARPMPAPGAAPVLKQLAPRVAAPTAAPAPSSTPGAPPAQLRTMSSAPVLRAPAPMAGPESAQRFDGEMANMRAATPRAPMADTPQTFDGGEPAPILRAPMPGPDGSAGDISGDLAPAQDPTFGGPSRPMNTPAAAPMRAPMAPPAGGEDPMAAPPGSTITSTAPNGGTPPIAPPAGNSNTNLGPLNDQLRGQTMSWLNNPSPYDDELFQREVERARVSHDRETARGKASLESDLARRGVDFGSIGRQGFNDFAVDRATAWDNNVMTPMLANRAQGMADARRQAFDAGNAERGYYDGQRNTARDQEIQRMQLQEAIRSGRVGEDQDWYRIIQQMTGQAGGAALDQAGMQGNTAAGNAGAVGDYAAYLARIYGNRAPGAPALPAPTGR